MTPPPLSARDVFALVARLGDVADRVVLVGGQAVNVWAEHYLSQGRAEELRPDAPFTSKDVDFCGGREAVMAFAARVPAGRARLASLDDGTPNVGVVTFVDDGGHPRVIDILSAPFGMDYAAVQRESVRMEVFDEAGQPTGVRYRVMHPVHSLESRVRNVVGLPAAYDTDRGRRQLRASVVCAREALKDLLDTPPAEGFDPVRVVLDLTERVFRLCLRDRHGRVVAQRTGIDPIDAIIEDPRLGDPFLHRRLPQLRGHLAAVRARLAR